MRFHLPALPGRPTTLANSHCAYSGYVRKMCRMMLDLGHEVFLYGMEANDAPATEHVVCYPDSLPVDFSADEWCPYNVLAGRAIRERAEPGDILGIIGGTAQQEVARGCPELRAVEYRVGYGGVFADFKVFESYAWMHMVYGSAPDEVNSHRGSNFDAVIPPPFEVELFPEGDGSGDYLLYVGRMTELKGIAEACEVARKLDCELILAGAGDVEPTYGAAIGPVGPEERAELMGGARALITPTLYVEPFGGVTIEAMMCGTPVLTTDWGAFTETVQPGVNGYRCRMLSEFCAAFEAAAELDRDAIREHAIATYSLEAIAARYQRYFDQLATLDEDGWYAENWTHDPDPVGA